MSRIGNLDKEEANLIADYVRNPAIAKAIYGQDVIRKHLESPLQILMEIKDIPRYPSYELVKAKATLINSAHSFNEKIEVECLVACGKLHKLHSVIQAKSFNLLDYLEHLISDFNTKRSRIGLFTFQNGIQNSFNDFAKMGESIVDKLKEINVFPLCIGLYNPTNGTGLGLVNDFQRLYAEWYLNAYSIICFRQMVITLARSLPRHVLWAHLAHSEGGVIIKEILTNTTFCLSRQNSSMINVSGQRIPSHCDIKDFCKRQLITVLYGAVAPVPNIVKYAINNYSKKDVTMRYASPYLDKFPKPKSNEDENLKKIAAQMVEHPLFPKSKSAEKVFNELKAGTLQRYIDQYPYVSTKNGCSVTILENIGESFCPISGDHAFQGLTYQNALDENLKELQRNYDICF